MNQKCLAYRPLCHHYTTQAVQLLMTIDWHSSLDLEDQNEDDSMTVTLGFHVELVRNLQGLFVHANSEYYLKNYCLM